MNKENVDEIVIVLSERIAGILKSFWWINFFVWLGYWSINTAVSPYMSFDLTSIRNLVLQYLMTALLRFIYLKVDYKNSSVVLVGVWIVLSSFLVSAFLYSILYAYEFVANLNFNIEELWNEMSGATTLYFIFYNSIIYMVLSVFYFIIVIRNDYLDEKKLSKQNTQLAQQAELLLLRYQLNPTFLFNSLSSIRALISKDIPASREMISELSEFLKYSILTKNDLELSLEKEIEALHHYLEIEKIRYQDKLDIIFEIEDAAKEFPIPVLLIHPLVENAIKYGMQTTTLPLTVTVKAYLDGNNFYLEVTNNGSWVQNKKHGNEDGLSNGIENVRSRLTKAYQENHNFTIFKKENFVKVQIVIFGTRKS